MPVETSLLLYLHFLKHHSWISGNQVHPEATAAADVKVCLILGQARYTFHQYWYAERKMYLTLTMDIYAYETAVILDMTQIHH